MKRLVLLDWGGTLCGHTGFVAMVRRAAARVGRDVDGAAMLQALVDAGYSNPQRDASVEAALAANVEELRLAGYDDRELALAIHEEECGGETMIPFPDTESFLEACRREGVRRVVVSNCGFDIRTNLAHHGLDHLVDAWVLSCEHGVVKPDPRLFEVALDGTDPAAALMVGDSSADAGAIKAGIDTILLPEARGVDVPRGFDLVLRALGIDA